MGSGRNVRQWVVRIAGTVETSLPVFVQPGTVTGVRRGTNNELTLTQDDPRSVATFEPKDDGLHVLARGHGVLKVDGVDSNEVVLPATPTVSVGDAELVFTCLPDRSDEPTKVDAREADEEISTVASEDIQEWVDASDEPAAASPALPLLHPKAAPATLGHFELIGRLGRGGQGVVFDAFDHARLARCALKVFEKGDLFDAARFAREQRIVRSLQHPCIARCYGTGRFETPGGERMYIAQEYLAGGPIDAIASKTSDWKLVLSIGKDLLDALAYAHSQKVVHRDVKPSNVLFVLPTGSGARPRAKLIDFGFGKDLSPTNAPMTARGVALALPFMSPEHIKDFRHVGFAGDVYGAAATIFHLLTGETPLVDVDPASINQNYEVVTAILNPRRRKLAKLRPDLPEQVAQAIDGVLETDATRRSETPAPQLRSLIARFV